MALQDCMWPLGFLKESRVRMAATGSRANAIPHDTQGPGLARVASAVARESRVRNDPRASVVVAGDVSAILEKTGGGAPQEKPEKKVPRALHGRHREPVARGASAVLASKGRLMALIA